jgi:hypothetical protein
MFADLAAGVLTYPNLDDMVKSLIDKPTFPR